MSTVTKTTLDDVLLEQGLDHILNSPEEEFAKLVCEHNLDLEQLASINGAAARKVIDAYNLKHAVSGAKIDPASVRFRPSNMLKAPVENGNYVERFLASAKALGFKFKAEYVDSLTENSMQHKMAFRSKASRHGKPRKKPRS